MSEKMFKSLGQLIRELILVEAELAEEWGGDGRSVMLEKSRDTIISLIDEMYGNQIEA